MASRRSFLGRKSNHITAAAGDVIDGANPASLDAILRRTEKWQERVLSLISSIPEPAGASALMRNVMSQVILELTGSKISESDRKEIEYYLSKFDTGRSGMLLWQVGECYPSWTINAVGDIEWDSYSPIELKVKNASTATLIGKNGKPSEVNLAGMQWFRMWQQDPALRYSAWSPHKGMLGLMEAMYLHQLADTAVATSRLAGAGILYWPTDLPSLPMKDGRPEEGSREYLQWQLSQAMMQSIKDRDGADAVVPMIVFGDTSYTGNANNTKPEHILLERPDDANAFSTRMDSYATRYARGVELPVESVQGTGPANHWTAWVIKEDKWRFYVLPLATVIADALNRNFVKPMLLQMGYSAADLRDVEVVPNGQMLIAKPDKSDKALRLAELGGYLTREAVLEETGFDPNTELDQAGTANSNNQKMSPLPTDARSTTPN